MHKTLFKHILVILDDEESNIIKKQELYPLLCDRLTAADIIFHQDDISKCIDYMLAYNWLKQTPQGIDVTPNATIFAKAPNNSILESLAFFACLYTIPGYQNILRQLSETSVADQSIRKYFDQISFTIFTQTALVSSHHGEVRLRKENRQSIHDFFCDVSTQNKDAPLLTSALLARFIAFMMDDEKCLKFKNQDKDIVPYECLSRILELLPCRGIPIDRSVTRHLQAFFKDTLYHEYAHRCAICGIDIAHMLIASHIKPFRDCAHLYEAVDYQNGILLCRNHDFLFDQGYISFSDEGKLLVSEQLSQQPRLQPYVFDLLYQLPVELTTNVRRMFLTYHRNHIFLGNETSYE